MKYLVPPGLYAIGAPGPADPVAVTANYKMSYDLVRRALSGRNIWLLVLETYGINVWCAAGKGTFGTAEIVGRIEATGLARVVSHRCLLLPILGAAGVAAHEVRRRAGFVIRFSVLRAADLPAFIDGGMRSTERMRELTFTTRERLVLTPVEVVQGIRNSLPILALLFLAGAFSSGDFSTTGGLYPALAYMGALLAGAVLVPLLLPWLPTRSFSLKGAVTGFSWAFLLYALNGDGWSRSDTVANFLLLPVVASFFALNFTGSTPFTSRSGVKKEMRLSLPVMACALFAGAAFWGVGRFFP